MEIFRILAAVLHLGNVNVQASGRNSERSSIDVRNVFSYLSEVSVIFCTYVFFSLLAISILMSVSSLSVSSQADDRSLAVFSKLLGVEGSQTAHWLCHRRLTIGGEMLVKPIAGQQAVEARDALAKHIYGQLFTWTVQRLNSALRTQRGKPKSFIGVLDIYGSVISTLQHQIQSIVDFM